MEKFTNFLTQEKAKHVLDASDKVAHQHVLLSEEFLSEIPPLPYSTSEEMHHDMATLLLEKVLLPYL